MTFTYGATAQTCNRLKPHAVTSTSDGKSYTYDCNGNLLTDGTRSFAWDADNKPVSILQGASATTFAYSGDGGRVKKVGGGRTIRYAGAFEDHVTDGVQVKHLFVGDLRVATRVIGGINAGIYFVHGDHLGSLNVLTNSSGQEVQRLTYKPYGETQSNSGSVDFHQYRFTDQEQDPETGLYFYQARYYNPVLGRFLSPDALVPQPGNPQSLNRYSYVMNNPVTLVDPSGHDPWYYEAEQASTLVISQTITDLWSLPSITSGGLMPWVDLGAANANFFQDTATFTLPESGGGNAIAPGLGQASWLPGLTPSDVGGILSKSLNEATVDFPGGSLQNLATNLYGYGDTAGKPQTGLYEYTPYNPVNRQDPARQGYLDVNVSGGYWGGFTAGVMINDNGFYPYLGGGLVTPGIGFSITWSPSNPTTGWNVGLQGQAGIAGQVGYGFGENGGWFWEVGGGWPPGASITGFYVLGPFAGPKR